MAGKNAEVKWGDRDPEFLGTTDYIKGKFNWLQILTDTVIAAIVGDFTLHGATVLTGKTLAAGELLRIDFSEIQLTSGLVGIQPDEDGEGEIAKQITYDDNGSTSGDVPTDTGYYITGEHAHAKTNSGTLAKTGYTWIGWNTETDGSGTHYDAADEVLFAGSDITLYAEWEAET